MNGSGMANGEHCSKSNGFAPSTGTGTGLGANANAARTNAGLNCGGVAGVYEEAEDEMVATERELAEDAQWKRIQQNTFTRWANEHLKTVNKTIANLETDLSDGLRLIALIEVLSGRRLPKHNVRPTFRSQQLENVSVALKFLADQGIKLVNIDSTDIVDCKLKLILGLIWTLILHYSITMPMWEGEGEIDPNYADKGPTPKQRLLNWIQSKLPDLPISNFTNDWNDGRAVGALVDAVAPGLCPDWQDWKSQNALQNAKEAMNLADQWLDVKQLIKPEELVNPNMDELSMMTYLSQYPSAKLKQGAPLRPKTNANRVRAYGPGIEPTGPMVSAVAKFTVETFSAGSGNVDVKVENPKGQSIPVDIAYNNDRSKTYSVTYTPKMEGKHEVSVYFAGKEIPKSPYQVLVEGTAGDASKVTASGPGLLPEGIMVNRSTYFDIFAKDAGRGTPEVIIVDTAGQQNAMPVKLYPTTPGVWRCEYIPPAVGPLNVNVFFATQTIPDSPYTVRVHPVSDAKKVKVTGRGIQANGVRVNDVATFHVNTEKAGEGKPEVQIIGPGGVNEPAAIKKVDNGHYDVTYHPKKPGRHIVMVIFAGQEVPRSPFEVNVGPYKETQIKAYGPGLIGGVVGYPAIFTVESNGETGALGFSIEGPSQAKIDCQDNGDGSADIKYYPTVVGEYAVHILCDGEDIPDSPYMAQILPNTDYYPNKVECSGKGLQGNLPVNIPVDFNVDTRKAGNAPLDVKVLDSNSNPIPVNIRDNRNGTFTSQYTPRTGRKHTIQVNYGGVAVPGSPFKVHVVQPVRPEKVQIFGPGVEAGVKPNKPTHFSVDCREAGQGNIDLKLKSDKGVEVPLQVTDNEDGTYLVDYVAPAPGDYALDCHYGGAQVPQTPLRINVPANVDLSKIKVDGLETMAPINSLQQFHVITEGAGKADFTLVIRSPSGQIVKAHIVPTHDGYLVYFTPTEVGEYWLNISFGGQPILQKPHKLVCTHGSDPKRVTAFGPGLERGIVKHPAEFVIDTKRAGRGGLGVTVEGPCEAAINCRDNGDGTCSVAYLPMEAGDYVINITFNDQPISGSPYHAVIVPDVDWKKIRVLGSGIQPHGVCLYSKAEFVVDSKDLGIRDDGRKVTCTITNPSGNKTENFITPQSDGTYKISYTPFEEGAHTIEILYDGLAIPGSPFIVNVKRGTDSTKCRAFGKGLEKGILNQLNHFTVETKGAGSGGLSLAIEGPSEAKMTCKDNRDGSCSVEYLPTEPGDYDIGIKFADKHIPGSPFKVEVEPVFNVNKVRVYGTGVDHCRAEIPSSFKIDASALPKAPLDVQLTSDGISLIPKPEVYDNGDGTYDVIYVANKEGALLTAKVSYNGEPIPKSPFKMRVRPKTEPDKVKVNGPIMTHKGGVYASMPTEFTIDASQAGVGNPEVQIIGPDREPRRHRVVDQGDGIYKVYFTPDDCGQYTVPVKFNGQSVPFTPIHIQAYATGSASDCHFPSIHNAVLRSNEEQRFTVDAKKAGLGKITCRIKSVSGNKDIDTRVVDNDDGTFTVYYKIPEPGEYTLSVKFGGQPVPEGLCEFTVADEKDFKKLLKSSEESKYSSSFERQFRAVRLDNIPLPTTEGHITAEIKMPSGKIDKPVIEDNRDGTVSLKYEPREEGLHELLVKYNGEHVQGSPFKFHVDSINSGYVTAYGPGLTHGVSGEPANFTISTKGAGAGGLALAVEGPSKAEISCHDNKDGTVSVSYLPTAPGEYKITVKFGDKHIRGSPYNAKITGEGRKRNQISVGSCSEVSFPGKITDADTRLLNASIQAPSGLEEPCFLKKLPSGNLGISFTPREIGEHVVSVKRMGKHIANSPFKITVGEREVGDAKKVKVSGNALHKGNTHVENFFNVDTRNAGYGGLSLSIEGPSKAEIQCKDNEDGTLKISYKPTEPGYYIVNLKFADHHVDGSPFTVKVTGEGSNRQREKIEKHRDAVPITEVGSQCKLTFKMPGIISLDLSATVSSPAGIVEDAVINEVEDGLYAVHFVPKELGVHTVSVKYKDIHIPGSPFQFTVGPLRDGGAHRVHAGGPGLERGEVGQPCEFNVWTREAGAGALAISVEGPSKAEIDFKDRRDGSCYVSYVVSEPGEYRVGIKFNDQHIPDSPYKLFVSPAMGDAHKLEVAQFPVSGVVADKPAHFLVHKNGAKGNLDGKIISPSGTEDDCFIQSIDAESYSVRFMPRENGIHNIHIKFNGVHIPGSPLRVKVGKEDADPAAVHAHGNGLGEVKTGQKTDFLVDTCNAGAGTLAVTIDGPSKVSMDCTEVEEGYKVRYTPLVPGDYYISLKYNGYHIVGSPFKVKCKGDKNIADLGAQETSSVVVETVQKVSKSAKVTGPQLPHFKSDANKVTCKGMGLKKAYLQKQNQFAVHAGDAGNNILFVGVYGPKGPCDEVFIKHTGRNNFNVNYLVKERGEYLILVKWGDEHIPGSPFRIEA